MHIAQSKTAILRYKFFILFIFLLVIILAIIIKFALDNFNTNQEKSKNADSSNLRVLENQVGIASNLQLEYLLKLRQKKCEWVGIEEFKNNMWETKDTGSSNFFLLQSFSEIAKASQKSTRYKQLAKEQLECFEKTNDLTTYNLPEDFSSKYGTSSSAVNLYYGSWLFAITSFVKAGNSIPNYAMPLVEMLAKFPMKKENPQEELRRINALATFGNTIKNPYFVNRAEVIFMALEKEVQNFEDNRAADYKIPQFLKASCILNANGANKAKPLISHFIDKIYKLKISLKGADDILVWYQIAVAGDACLDSDLESETRNKIKNLFEEALVQILNNMDPKLGGIIEYDPQGNSLKTISVNAEIARILFRYKNNIYNN